MNHICLTKDLLFENVNSELRNSLFYLKAECMLIFNCFADCKDNQLKQSSNSLERTACTDNCKHLYLQIDKVDKINYIAVNKYSDIFY